jgi:opacity protein-like surface antigen
MVRKILLFGFIFSNFALSEDLSLEKFFGLEVGNETIKAENIIGGKESNSGVSFGLKTGVQNYEWRTTMLASSFNKDNQESFKTLITFDKFIWASVYESETTILKPYFGFNAGWLRYKNTGIKKDGLIYGVQGGFTLGLSDGVDVDIGYRYSNSEVDTVDNIGNLLLSINYIFE